MTVKRGVYAPKEPGNLADVLKILLNEAWTHVDIGARAGFALIKKYRNTGVSLICSDEFEGTPNERQIF